MEGQLRQVEAEVPDDLDPVRAGSAPVERSGVCCLYVVDDVVPDEFTVKQGVGVGIGVRI